MKNLGRWRRLFLIFVMALTTQWTGSNWMISAYAAETSGYQVGNRLENDRQVLSAASQCLRDGETEGEFWVTGRNYVPEGTVLKAFYGDQLEYSSTLEEIFTENGQECCKMRFSVRWKQEDSDGIVGGETAGGEAAGEGSAAAGNQTAAGKRYWRLGDVVTREINGSTYTFRCIDQEYQKGSEAEVSALFLCDSVISADTGSYYAYEKQENGTYGYVLHQGPIVDFGDTSQYKYSRVRQWLKEAEEQYITWYEQQEGQAEAGGLEPVWIDVGVDYSCTGQTAQESFEQLQEEVFRQYSLGYQQMADLYFILSVDEALKYRQYLWRFAVMPDEGGENPESQIGPYSKGYWLRTPEGSKADEDSGKVYVVDLVNGTIRPEQVTYDKSEDENEDENRAADAMSIGIRPAFALVQQG